MCRWIVASLIVALIPVSAAQAQGGAQVFWTVSGAGAGFGVGSWAGLSVFDDAVNSDRKVWTSAIAGAGIGAVAGYLIGRARRDRTSTATRDVNRGRPEAFDRHLIERLAKSIRFDRGRARSAPPLAAEEIQQPPGWLMVHSR